MVPTKRFPILLAALAAAACSSNDAVRPDLDDPGDPAVINQQLTALRSATERFRDIGAAQAANYTILFDPDGDGPGSACLSDPTAGSMGEHFVDVALLSDGGKLDINRPEALIYEPMQDGTYRLVAVEYVVPFSDRPKEGPAPTLFGQTFMPNDNPGFHLWALHVWIWENNPSGMFAPYNPGVSCRYSRN